MMILLAFSARWSSDLFRVLVHVEMEDRVEESRRIELSVVSILSEEQSILYNVIICAGNGFLPYSQGVSEDQK